ncbi:GMC family oxidoreductase [Steroidobacter agaridevorans]|uniref:GMC family oxidoreductase n=1 Tax=Steroidobacter agaridevorans TaxID=2695856 RepID=A0A829YAK4_9GAMM|nr:GMC family oxidoreductase [Steroidobacter agaridevorans]GFE80085.1 GMC family oxidoreductase [Steroidobacter agaridevorans]
MARANTFDAIVVGSGMSGGWAAKELTERGLKTLVLERGRNLRHIVDYRTALQDPWQLPHYNRPSQQDRAAQPIQSTLYLYDQSTKQHFVNDLEHPYAQAQPFNWYRGSHVGGRSLMWARHVFRYSDLDFEANLREGTGVDWPIRYADIAPWYEHVERFIGASGENAGLPQLPDQVLQPAFEMNAFEKHIRSRFAAKFTDRKLICSATAVLSREHNGRGPCQGRNQCARGCPFSAYFSSNGVTLPAAAATGRLTLQPDSIVHSLIYDDSKRRVTGVRVIDARTKQTTEYSARVVFLCASTLGSTAILLNSRSSRFPNGLGNDSGVLGHYLMDHHNGGGAVGSFSQLSDRYYRGRRSTSMYIPRFRNVAHREKSFMRGYGYEVYTSRQNWTRGLESAGFGAAFKNEITRPGKWQVYMEGYGETLPYKDNRVWLDPDRPDPWGLPTINVSMSYRDNERRMSEQMMADAVEMLKAADVEEVSGFNRETVPGSVIHEMGTARMGRDPKTSVLDMHNQVHAVPNVFVTDGSCMVSSPTQNPSLTYMALTARASAYAVERLGKGEI